MRRWPALFVAAVLLLLITAFGGGETVPRAMPPATAESTPSQPTPTAGEALTLNRPAARMLAGSAVVPGTACSLDGLSNLCGDVFGVPTLPVALSATPASPFRLEFELGTPDPLILAWFAAPALPVDNPVLTGPNLLWMPEGERLDPPAPGTFPAEPGRYLLEAIAIFPGQASVHYGWYIEVE